MSDVALRKTGRGVPLRNRRESVMARVSRSAVIGRPVAALASCLSQRSVGLGGDKDAPEEEGDDA